MTRDHYVAQTYLRRFGDANRGNLMHGYLKSPLKDFPCHPRNVCHEWDGDQNLEFITNCPELRAEFRTMCEPHWNGAVEALLSTQLDQDGKFVMAAMAATLMTCTPTWRRIGTSTYNDFTKGTAIAGHDLTLKAGMTPQIKTEAVQMLRDGRLKVETDPKFIEAKFTRNLLQHARMIYNQPWTVLYNGTDFPFITSDNPFVFIPADPGRAFTRFLPITPQVCLEIPFVNDLEPEEHNSVEFDLSRRPKGEITFGAVRPVKALGINRLIVQSAERMVLSRAPDERVRALVSEFAGWGVEQQFVEFPAEEENAVYQGTVLKVRERTAI